MKINALNKLNINFYGRKKEIKKADAILRQTKETFPMLSRTYLDYLSLRPNPYLKKRITPKQKQYLRDKIISLRYSVLNASNHGIPIYQSYVANVKKEKIGNCTENSIVSLAVLCANGYYNSKRASLYYVTNFQSKKTGEKETSIPVSMDHVCILTDMGTEGERNIVIDSWLNVAESKEGAIAKFKALYSELSKKEAQDKAIHILAERKKCSFERIKRQYYITSNFELITPKEYEIEDVELKRLGQYTRKHYPEVVIG